MVLITIVTGVYNPINKTILQGAPQAVATTNGHLDLVESPRRYVDMVIFHSYVSLPDDMRSVYLGNAGRKKMKPTQLVGIKVLPQVHSFAQLHVTGPTTRIYGVW